MRVYNTDISKIIKAIKQYCFDCNIELVQEKEIPYGISLKLKRQKDKVSVNIYHGKKGTSILVQGKKDSILCMLLNKLKMRLLKQSAHTNDEDFIIGTDEAGKGDYFGPLVICGVATNKKTEQALLRLGVKDSKRLSNGLALDLAEKIRKFCEYTIIKITPFKYNTLYEKFENLNSILAWAHARAIENLIPRVQAKKAIVDKFADESFINSKLLQKGRNIEIIYKTKAEVFPCVAAASIIARATFLIELSKLSAKANIELLPGSTPKVLCVARNFVKQRKDKNILKNYAKLHFNLTDKIL